MRQLWNKQLTSFSEWLAAEDEDVVYLTVGDIVKITAGTVLLVILSGIGNKW